MLALLAETLDNLWRLELARGLPRGHALPSPLRIPRPWATEPKQRLRGPEELREAIAAFRAPGFNKDRG